MTSTLDVDQRKRLLVFDAAPGDGSFSQRVFEVVHALGYRLAVRAACMPDPPPTDGEVLAALIDLDATNPLLEARRLRLREPGLHIVFVGSDESARMLRSDLAVELLLGAQWSIASWRAGTLARVLGEIERDTARRAQLCTALDDLNRRLAEAPDIDALERAPDGNGDALSIAALGAAPDGALGALIWMDRRGRVLTWSPAAEELLGWSEREALQRYVPTLAGGSWPIELLALVEQARGGRAVARRELELERADGLQLRVEVDVNPARDAQGGIGSIAVLVRDVTLRRDARAVQQGSRETWLRLAQEVAGLGAWEWDIARGGVVWSPNLERLHGLPVGTFDGTFAAHLNCVHAEDRARVESSLQATLEGAAEHRVEHRVVWPDGSTHWIESRGTVQRDAHGAPERFIGLCIDIDDRKQLQMELGRRVRELALADQRKNEFLAMLAHELRNPLAPIRNAIGVLDAQPGSDDTAQWARGVIRRQVSHLSRLIDDLVDVNRLTTGKIELRKEPVDVSTVVSNAVETSRPLIEAAGHELRIELPRESLYVHADALRLAQVFANLLNNAAKYTHPGGHITLSVSAGLDGIRVSIEDDGVGIPPEMIARVFDMFVQVDRSLEKEGGGLGIGLAIAKSLVELHGGRLEAHSTGLGSGSAFVITLPRVPAPTENRASGRAANGTPNGERLRILVADDNQDSAQSLALMLKIMGHETEVAHDGEHALAVAARFRPQVVLLDLGMPKRNGYETCTQMRAEPWGKSALFVAVTGWGQEEDRRRSREAGFDHHLVKPLDPVALRDLLTRRSERSADIARVDYEGERDLSTDTVHPRGALDVTPQ